MDVFQRPPEGPVRRLLEEAGLPITDLTPAHFEHFFACGTKDAPEGAVGIELHGPDALLRSLVVAERARGRGYGRALVAEAEQHARAQRVRRIYLLTTTAEPFFARAGYRSIAREEAPERIRATHEFSSLCGSTATLMAKNLMPHPAWSIGRVIGHTLLVALAFIAVSIAVAIGMSAFLAATNSAFDPEAWAAGIETDGVYVSFSTIATALVCVPFTKFLVARRSAAPSELLGVRRVDARTVADWCGTLAVFVLASDLLTTSLGRPIVPVFMTDIYATSPPLLLLVALVVAAPAFEEIFFRGFIIGALVARGTPAFVAAVVSALFWAVIHLQYDLYGIGTIFVMGLLLAAARLKTGSIVPCIAMHALANAIAFAETVWLTSSAATG